MERFAWIVALAGGVTFVGLGAWAFVAPLSFFEVLATFEPYNAHFVRDLGAFQIGLGAVLLASTVLERALVAGLAGVATGAVFHTIAHILDGDLGGQPATDIPFFAVTAALLAGGAVAAHRSRPDRGSATRRAEDLSGPRGGR